jgi:hypothetical protein
MSRNLHTYWPAIGSDCSGRYSWQTAPMRARAVSHVGLHTGESKTRGIAPRTAHVHCAVSHVDLHTGESTRRSLAPRTAHAHCAVSHDDLHTGDLTTRSLAPRTAHAHAHVTIDERSVGLPIGVLILMLGSLKLEDVSWKSSKRRFYCII